MADRVKKTAVRVAMKAGRTLDVMAERITLLEWERTRLRIVLRAVNLLIGEVVASTETEQERLNTARDRINAALAPKRRKGSRRGR